MLKSIFCFLGNGNTLFHLIQIHKNFFFLCTRLFVSLTACLKIPMEKYCACTLSRSHWFLIITVLLVLALFNINIFVLFTNFIKLLFRLIYFSLNSRQILCIGIPKERVSFSTVLKKVKNNCANLLHLKFANKKSLFHV